MPKESKIWLSGSKWRWYLFQNENFHILLLSPLWTWSLPPKNWFICDTNPKKSYHVLWYNVIYHVLCNIRPTLLIRNTRFRSRYLIFRAVNFRGSFFRKSCFAPIPYDWFDFINNQVSFTEVLRCSSLWSGWPLFRLSAVQVPDNSGSYHVP